LKWEKIYEKSKELPDPSTATSHEYRIVLSIIKEKLLKDPKTFSRLT